MSGNPNNIRKPSTLIQGSKQQPKTQCSLDKIPQLIGTLKNFGFVERTTTLNLLREASHILESQPNTLKLTSPLTVIGDIHGQFYDLLNIFSRFGEVPQNTYLFLGDYVDRGKFCIETVILLLALKRLYPQKIFLLRGNHQGRTMTSTFNFKIECQKKFDASMYENFLETFSKLPLCAIIDRQFFAVHGGISPKIDKIDEIDRIDRFFEVEEDSRMLDLLWSDPHDKQTNQWQNNSMRCCSYYFSPIHSRSFLVNNQLKMIIRAHEVVQKGYKYQYAKDASSPQTLTVFSAPNYCETYQNKAAALVINDGKLAIKAFSEVEHPLVLDNYMNVFDLTLPLLTVQVTKLFKTAFKKADSKIKKRRASGQYEELSLKTLQNVNSVENLFMKNTDQILGYLEHGVSRRGKSQKVEEEQSYCVGVGVFCDFLDRFTAMKMNDSAEKMPLLIGPRSLNLVKMKRKELLDDYEDDMYTEQGQ